MNLIVDNSILVQYFLTEAYTLNVIALIEQIRLPDELCVPHFCILECVNVFWKRVRFNGMAQADAEQMTQDLAKLPLRVIDASDVYPDALQIGIRYNLAVYGSVYIALAKQLNYPLITVDQKQATAAQSEGVTLKPITDFTP